MFCIGRSVGWAAGQGISLLVRLNKRVLEEFESQLKLVRASPPPPSACLDRHREGQVVDYIKS